MLAKAKGKWLDMEIPENISFDCARFLLSAPEGVVLDKRERNIYEAMRRYKLIELNLDAPLIVKIPWTPSQTRGPGDVQVQCIKCLVRCFGSIDPILHGLTLLYRRSITIMSHEHVDLCGLCVTSHRLSPAKLAARYPGVEEVIRSLLSPTIPA